DLSSVLWGSRFGATSGPGMGRPNISPTAFLVDFCDKIYISGWGSSIQGGNLSTAGLPHTNDAYQTTTDGNDFYLVVFDIDMQGSAPLYATFFGGTQSSEHVDGGTSRFDRRGRVYQAVCAGCGGHSDFPIEPVPGAWSAQNNSSCNLGVFKFDFDAPLVIAGLSAPDTLCANAPVPFTDHSHLAATYLWDFGDGNTSTEAEPTHSYAGPGTYTVTLTVANDAACNTQDIDSIQVIVLDEAPTLEPMADITLCGPTPSVELTANSNGTADLFIWSSTPSFGTPLNPTPADSTAIVQPPQAGTYYVQASSPGSCPTVGQVQVVASLLNAAAPDDAFICADVAAVLTLTGIDPGSTIVWSPADLVDSGQGTTQITTTPEQTTEFQVQVTGPTGCAWSATMEVLVSSMNSTEVQASVDQSMVLSGTLVQLSVVPTTNVDISWSPAGAVSDPTSANPTAFITATTTFTVTVSNGVCTQPAQVTVKVVELQCDEPDIFVPNAFTPNGDGNNDVLFVRGRPIASMEWKLFDRWGELVFESTSLSQGWDGTFGGKPVDPAVFVYWLKAECIDGQQYLKKGNVTVIR
ncbi:MAG TPA: PKD domain-containing protein, partial [Flavobacteriales bacterium]